ncbi:MAG: L-2-amino-thiazoline-4-carboxylic acid hydrolase [Treponema sp.]|nr:L-2-amino-thiazoline-4-carboxylic acid hydrolase [Treponema sp.]
MGIKNTAKKNGFFVRNLRIFFEHRALWLYLLCDEARKKGIKPESFVPAAIHRCGTYHGIRALTGLQTVSDQWARTEETAAKQNSCKLLQKKLFSPSGRAVFEMKFIKLTEDVFDVDFHYCPLVSAWQKQGCSGEEIDKLCDWAMEGDRGIAEAFGCELELRKTIAKGDGICQIRFKRK